MIIYGAPPIEEIKRLQEWMIIIYACMDSIMSQLLHGVEEMILFF